VRTMHSRPMQLIPAPAHTSHQNGLRHHYLCILRPYPGQRYSSGHHIIYHFSPVWRIQVDDHRAGKGYGFRPAPCVPSLEERVAWRTAQAPAGIACGRAPALWPQRPQEPSLARRVTPCGLLGSPMSNCGRWQPSADTPDGIQWAATCHAASPAPGADRRRRCTG